MSRSSPAIDLPDTASSVTPTGDTEVAPLSCEVVESRYGPLVVPGGSDLISRFIRSYGEWGWLEASFVAGFVDRGARVLDGGAFVGSFTLSLAERHPERVVAVEANQLVLPLLQRNLGTLAQNWTTIEHGLLGDGVTPALAPRATHEDNLGSTSFKPLGESRGELAPLPLISPMSLKSLRNQHGPFDLIKLDVEGFELAALQADADWLGANKPTLWLECNEDPAVLPLYDFVVDLGYDVHYVAFPSFNPENHLGNPQPIFAVAYEAGLLAVKSGTVVRLPELQARTHCDLSRVKNRSHLRQCLWLTPRWGLAEWANMPRQRLLGLCSRLHRGHSFGDFLSSP